MDDASSEFYAGRAGRPAAGLPADWLGPARRSLDAGAWDADAGAWDADGWGSDAAVGATSGCAQPAACVYTSGAASADGYPSLADCETAGWATASGETGGTCNNGANRCVGATCPGCYVVRDDDGETRYYCPGMSSQNVLFSCNHSVTRGAVCPPGYAVWGVDFYQYGSSDNIFNSVNKIYCATPAMASTGDVNSMLAVDANPANCSRSGDHPYVTSLYCPAGQAVAAIRTSRETSNSTKTSDGVRRIDLACLPFKTPGQATSANVNYTAVDSSNLNKGSEFVAGPLATILTRGSSGASTRAGDQLVQACYPPTPTSNAPWSIYPKAVELGYSEPAVDSSNPSYGNFFMSGIASTWSAEANTSFYRADHMSIVCSDLSDSLDLDAEQLACCTGQSSMNDAKCTAIGMDYCTDNNVGFGCTNACDSVMAKYCASEAGATDTKCSCINSPFNSATTEDGTNIGQAGSAVCYDCVCAGAGQCKNPGATTSTGGYLPNNFVRPGDCPPGQIIICTNATITTGDNDVVTKNTQINNCSQDNGGGGNDNGGGGGGGDGGGSWGWKKKALVVLFFLLLLIIAARLGRRSGAADARADASAAASDASPPDDF